MAPTALVMSFFSVLTAEVVVLPLGNPAGSMAVLSGDYQGLAVVTAKKVVIFSDEATRVGGGYEIVATLRPRLGTECASIGAILALENGTLAVGTCHHATCGYFCTEPAVEIYNSQAVMSSAAPSVVLDNLRAGHIDVMTQLSDGRLVAQSSIFAREALIQGGNATTVLDTKYADLNAVTPFQGGLAYTSSNAESLLVFDAVAVASGGDPDAAWEWGGDALNPPDRHPAKWRIPEHICAGPSHVFADGAIAVLGTCELSFGTYEETAELLLLEDVDLEAQTIKNRSFSVMKGKPMHVLALPGGLMAVGVTTVECDEGHVEIFEESALRSGGEPALVVKASGSVGSMAIFRDGRLAVSTFIGGFSGGHCGGSYTVDIIDVAAEMHQHSSVSV